MAPPSHQGALPVELHERILDILRSDHSALLALRGANKAFRAFYTPAAFHTVHIYGSVGGALKLARMFTLDIVQHVKHLEFRTLKDDLEEYRCESVDQQVIVAFRCVWPLLSPLHQVTSATIVLNDWGTCIERQSLFLLTISHLPLGTLKSLTITNFSPYKHHVFKKHSHLSVLQSLQSVESLHLSVTSFRGEEHGEIINYRSIWASKQLFYSMRNLKSLSIHSSWPIVGGAAFCTRFSHLESLSLESFMLGDETVLLQDDNGNWASPQEFLAMHGSTLKSLKLMNCAVLAHVLNVGYRRPIFTAARAWKMLSGDMRVLKEVEVAFDAERPSWSHHNVRETMGRWKGYYTGTNARADWWFFELFGEAREHQGALPSADQIPNLEDDDRELANFITRVREGRPVYDEEQEKYEKKLMAEGEEIFRQAVERMRLAAANGS